MSLAAPQYFPVSGSFYSNVGKTRQQLVSARSRGEGVATSAPAQTSGRKVKGQPSSTQRGGAVSRRDAAVREATRQPGRGGGRRVRTHAHPPLSALRWGRLQKRLLAHLTLASRASLTQALRSRFLQPLRVADGESSSPSRLLAALNAHGCCSLETRSKQVCRLSEGTPRGSAHRGPRTLCCILQAPGVRSGSARSVAALFMQLPWQDCLPWQPGDRAQLGARKACEPRAQI